MPIAAPTSNILHDLDWYCLLRMSTISTKLQQNMYRNIQFLHGDSCWCIGMIYVLIVSVIDSAQWLSQLSASVWLFSGHGFKPPARQGSLWQNYKLTMISNSVPSGDLEVFQLLEKINKYWFKEPRERDSVIWLKYC